ncbi:MAG TPA: 16S rRNA (uracil(1498)-N(3))-methyltransferase [Clostridiaceae bacterium]|jgi:16S rRNA (uracil1498-N3)-methyltransferase|nr:16S rRNA (uracil(1498)-N(3))-methyltransferase [Clostridiaceae bacterium]
MPKFFIKNNQVKGEYIDITGDDVNHIKNVLRLKIDDCIQVCNSDTGNNYKAQIVSVEKSNIKCSIIEKLNSTVESNVYIHILQGLPKADKMELIIQKCTELGVQEITPVNMERSIVKLNPKDETKKIQRWQKIAEVAAKQSGRDKITQINNIVKFKDIFNVLKDYDAFLVAYEKEKENTLKKELIKLKEVSSPKVAVLIGPEGGIDDEEIKILKTNNTKIITLGKRILRTETAPLAISSIIQYELEK